MDTSSVLIDAAIYMYGIALMLIRWRQVLRAARTAWPLLALAGLAFLSTAWSVEPMLTLRRSVIAPGIHHDRDLRWRAIFDQSICAPARPDSVLDDCAGASGVSRRTRVCN